jgi:hypothetical protein
MDYKYKYLKYKKMYLSLKNKISQVGGAAVNTIDNIEEIREIYRQIPSSGMYHTNKKESKKNFNRFCTFLLNNSPDQVAEILELQELKRRKKHDKVDKINKQQGDQINVIGSEFEETVFRQMSQIISDKTGQENIRILKNHKLFEIIPTKNGEKQNTREVGEIDAIIVDENNNVVAIAEIKSSFDGIPDALYQAKRALNNLSKDGIIIEDENKQIITGITSRLDQDDILDKVFIFSKFDRDVQYFNFPAAFKHGLLNALVIYKNNKKLTKVKEKIFNNIKKKQAKGRYTMDVLGTLALFEKKGMLDHIQLIL